jgi:hypothetical protein
VTRHRVVHGEPGPTSSPPPAAAPPPPSPRQPAPPAGEVKP